MDAKGKGKHRRPMPADKKTAGITSLVRSLESTLVNDPEGLRYVAAILDATSEARQVAIATLLDRGVVTGVVLANIMECSGANVSKMAAAGRVVIAEREALAGVERFPAAARDRRRRAGIAAEIQASERRAG